MYFCFTDLRGMYLDHWINHSRNFQLGYSHLRQLSQKWAAAHCQLSSRSPCTSRGLSTHHWTWNILCVFMWCFSVTTNDNNTRVNDTIICQPLIELINDKLTLNMNLGYHRETRQSVAWQKWLPVLLKFIPLKKWSTNVNFDLSNQLAS